MKAGGVSQYFQPDGKLIELNTRKCVHCQRMVEYATQRDIHTVMDFCRNCFGMICIPCTARPCVHHMKTIEKAEDNYHRKQQLRRALGLE